VQEINLYHLLKYYLRHYSLVLLCTLIGLLLGLAYNQYIQRPLYRSDATLLIVSANKSSSAQDTTLINNYIELIKSRRVLEPVIKKQSVGMSYEALAASTSASNNKDTEVIKISIRSDDKYKSKALVDDAVVSFKDQVKALYGVDDIQTVDTASLANGPYNVRKSIQAVVAAIVGFMGAVVVLFFVYDFKISQVGKEAEAEIKLLIVKKKHKIRKHKIKAFLQKSREKLLIKKEAEKIQKVTFKKSGRSPGRPKKRGRPKGSKNIRTNEKNNK
jgi:capsular polysaccharide biosynthesis protein